MRQRIFTALILALLLAPAGGAYVLLTNGVPYTFLLPQPETASTFYNGDLGYSIYVPPGSTKLTIDFAPVSLFYDVDLLVRYNAEVGMSGTGPLLYDYRTSGGPGNKEIVITPQSSPPLQSGTYYIAFLVNSTDIRVEASITATVEGGSIPPVRVVALSSFDQDLDGWTANTSTGGLPGASQGDPASTLVWDASGGNTGGFAHYYQAESLAAGAFVAPAKFLGNLSGLQDPRFEFDFVQLTGSETVYSVEIRIFGANTAYSWQGPIPPSPVSNVNPCVRLVLNPITNKYDCEGESNVWSHYTAALKQEFWNRLTGDASLATVLSNVQRIEVLANLTFHGGSSGIDNFALLSRGTGPIQPVAAGNTSFASGADGWTRNYPASNLAGATTGNADSTFRWVAFDGNPGGYIRVNSSGGANPDALVAPDRFLGDYTALPSPQFEFDYLHLSNSGASKPVQIRLIAADSVFVWTGPVPTAGLWTHYVAPLKDSLWQRVSGATAFAQALSNVERIEISAQQSGGPESDGLDNFWLMPSPITPAPPALSASPSALSLEAVARSSNPSTSLGITSIGGGRPLAFTVAATGGNWLHVSAASGTTPLLLKIWADITGLAPGTYTGQLTVTAPGTSLDPRTVAVNLTVSAQAGTIPRIYPGGIVNSASYQPLLAAGALGTIFGTGLSAGPSLSASFLPGTSSLPTRLQGTRVLVNDPSGALIAEAPLFYVSGSQINFQLPFEAFGRSQVSVAVDNNGSLSDPQTVSLAPAALGIFTYDANRAVAVNEDETVNSPENPAAHGSVLTVYMTGQGVVTPTVPTGAAALDRPLSRAPFPAQASIGGAPAKLLFVGLAPGMVGVLQVNLVVPSAAPAGDSPLVFTMNGSTSNSAIVTVR